MSHTKQPPADRQATRHEASARRLRRVVAEDTGPSAAHMLLAGMPRKQGLLMLELELTYQSPEKKEEHPRNHIGGFISTANCTPPAESVTDLVKGAHAVCFS